MDAWDPEEADADILGMISPALRPLSGLNLSPLHRPKPPDLQH